MRNGWAIIGVAIAFGLTLLASEFARSQCSMCRAVTDSNQLADDAFAIGSGLNNAIIYMMLTPYVFAAIFIYAFFRKEIGAWLKGLVS